MLPFWISQIRAPSQMLHLRVFYISFSFSLVLPYLSLLRNTRSERGRRIQYMTGVSARKVVEKRWWEKHAVGPNSARAACSRRPERKATRLNKRVRLSGIRSENVYAGSRVRKSPGAVFIFFGILASVRDSTDLFISLIIYRDWVPILSSVRSTSDIHQKCQRREEHPDGRLMNVCERLIDCGGRSMQIGNTCSYWRLVRDFHTNENI